MRILYLVEALKNRGSFARWNADAGVRDSDLEDFLRNHVAHRYGNRAVVGELEAIIDQVGKNVLQFTAVALHRWQVSRIIP